MRLLVAMHGAIPSVCRNYLAAKLRGPLTLQVRNKGSKTGRKGGKKGGNRGPGRKAADAGGGTGRASSTIGSAPSAAAASSRAALHFAVGFGLYCGCAGAFRLCAGRWPGTSSEDMEETRNEIAAHVGAPLEGSTTIQGAVQLTGSCQERGAGIAHRFCPTQCKVLFQPDGTFSGAGSDSDGNFIVADGLFNPQTNQIAWCEKGIVTTLMKGQLVNRGPGAGVLMEGVYESKTTENSGNVQLRVSPLLQHLDSHASPGAGNGRRPYNRMLDCSHVERVLLVAYFPLIFGKKYYDQWRAGQREREVVAAAGTADRVEIKC